MTVHSNSLREDALRIWQAGVDAVRSEQLVRNVLSFDGQALTVCGGPLSLTEIDRIAVVGAGKAGAGMAAAVEQVLGTAIVDERVSGWVNVPADCVRHLRKIHLHAARPAGVNEPTAAGVEGSLRILKLVKGLGPRDLCLVLISGGGSALLPAPDPAITLEDKQAVTRFLMRSGATIQELNAVRKRLSRIKGGGLGRAIRAGRTFVLIISDVIGDPLDVIASGPTVADSGTPAEALEVLEKFAAQPPAVPQAVFDCLRRQVAQSPSPPSISPAVVNRIIGNNRLAVEAALSKARELGYTAQLLGYDLPGEANAVGRELAEQCLNVRSTTEHGDRPICLVSGGEPVVRLTVAGRSGKGGRNQQLVLAAVDRLRNESIGALVLLSGGTDGEDGPTDAAGAVLDATLVAAAQAQGLDPQDYLSRNDAYHFFERLGGLIKTGPTHTNVMDLRVALVGMPAPEGMSQSRMTNV